ncbi:hypothetical protein HmCmsJML023_03349 [Escherichia coli]|nr:hypothetical protein HmCmsJML023_03349 [Escherichia coli]
MAELVKAKTTKIIRNGEKQEENHTLSEKFQLWVKKRVKKYNESVLS